MNIPKTTTRVEEHTDPSVKARIHWTTAERLARLKDASRETLERRLEELDGEWDIERTLEANAAGAVLAGVLLGRYVHRVFYAFPAVVGAFLMQHAVQGWCPPMAVWRRAGVRTAREIEEERRGIEDLIEDR